MDLACLSMTRTLLSRKEAAASMGMSLRSWERHVQPEVRVVVVGQLVRVRPQRARPMGSGEGEGASSHAQVLVET